MKLRVKFAALLMAVGTSAALGLTAGPATAGATGTTGPVNGGVVGTYSTNTVTNSQWMIVNSTLSVTNDYGWVSTFAFTQKTPVGTNHSPAISTGTVTDTTSYGSSSVSFTTTGPAPFGGSNGAIWADNGNWYGLYYANTPELPQRTNVAPAGSSNPAGWLMFNVEYNMVYFDGGQNAAYWFGT